MYRSQTQYLRDRFKASSIDKNYLSLLNDEPVDNFGGFVAFYSEKAEEICAGLNKRDIYCDNRGHILRLGLAPYITTTQINKCIETLPEVINEIFRMKEQE
jgi:kynureninase